LFIDEIHALSSNLAEVLYTAMEEFKMHICIDHKTVTVPTVPFTLIGATTAPGLVPKPLLSRFRITARLELYSVEDLALIAEQMAGKQHFRIAAEAAVDIAKRSRGTARLVRNFIDRSIDVTVNRNNQFISVTDTTEAFKMLSINDEGLNAFEVDLLRKLSEQYADKPVGVETLAMLMDEDIESFKQNYEPYLLQKGYIARTSEGRMLTPRGADVINKEEEC
jgi:Holliday junction DNA helicase RuvB